MLPIKGLGNAVELRECKIAGGGHLYWRIIAILKDFVGRLNSVPRLMKPHRGDIFVAFDHQCDLAP